MAEGITNMIVIHPKGSMSVCTNFEDNPSNSCWDTSIKNTNDNIMTAGDHQNHDS